MPRIRTYISASNGHAVNTGRYWLLESLTFALQVLFQVGLALLLLSQHSLLALEFDPLMTLLNSHNLPALSAPPDLLIQVATSFEVSPDPNESNDWRTP